MVDSSPRHKLDLHHKNQSQSIHNLWMKLRKKNKSHQKAIDRRVKRSSNTILITLTKQLVVDVPTAWVCIQFLLDNEYTDVNQLLHKTTLKGKSLLWPNISEWICSISIVNTCSSADHLNKRSLPWTLCIAMCLCHVKKLNPTRYSWNKDPQNSVQDQWLSAHVSTLTENHSYISFLLFFPPSLPSSFLPSLPSLPLIPSNIIKDLSFL